MELEIEKAELVLLQAPAVDIPRERHILIEGIQLERLEIHGEGIKERNMELRNSGKERQKAQEDQNTPREVCMTILVTYSGQVF
jgi:hypothetical protein